MRNNINSLTESNEDLGKNSWVHYNGNYYIITNVNGDNADLLDPMDHGQGISGVPLKDLTPVTTSVPGLKGTSEKRFLGPRNLVFEDETTLLSADEKAKVSKMVRDANNRYQASLTSEPK